MKINPQPSFKEFCFLVADANQIEMPSWSDQLFDKLSILNSQREEILLAVMAAGVPAGCIELTPVEQKADRYGNQILHAGFRFTTTEVYR